MLTLSYSLTSVNGTINTRGDPKVRTLGLNNKISIRQIYKVSVCAFIIPCKNEGKIITVFIQRCQRKLIYNLWVKFKRNCIHENKNDNSVLQLVYFFCLISECCWVFFFIEDTFKLGDRTITNHYKKDFNTYKVRPETS